ncbi:VanZ family protein [Caldicellulosiruptor morganii]|uniref:VanZ family protein n=1 Tax=Caldicellulosiruptor morganii TaxID=1387555 RepID=A0ABY7BLA7_9FIRM|nr:VanZ family protein [Caldicellulosiruptor morganii]WAM33627.1 VanZ family protein [Caldicellulosiruptor morganii]
MNKKTHKLLSWIIVILWLLIIFSLSSQPAKDSNRLSESVTKQVVKATQKVSIPNIQIEPRRNALKKLNDVIRKYAHVAVYLVLGILVINAFVISGIKGCKAFFFSLMFCFLYAATDEIHQVFVPGRGAKATDVLIDGIGAFTGIIIYELIFKICQKTKTESSSKRL